jgi:peptidoglycan/xylan/chitin deacetylase (PgdA/CDA1 family)
VTVDRKARQRWRTAAWCALQCAGLVAVAGGLYAGPAAAAGAAAVLLATLAAGHRIMYAPGGVPVIVYHSVSPSQDWLPWADEIAVEPACFERQLRMLARAGFAALSNDEFLRRRREGLPMPVRPVVIHLDDGYLDNWVFALPILERLGMPATIMVSLDFIEQGNDLRRRIDEAGDTPLRLEGYMNWAEIVATDRSGLVAIEAHGTDHGRVETGPEVVDTLTADNWRALAWVQWREMPGSKADWHREREPSRVPLGTPVRRNAPALAARAWSERGCETEADYRRRVRGVLTEARRGLELRLERRPALFCWPENAVTPAGHAIALEVGYQATTGGRGENRPGEAPTVVSRVHAGDGAIGWSWPWIDDLRLYAACRAFHGVYYWCFVLFAIHGTHHVVVLVRRIISHGRP